MYKRALVALDGSLVAETIIPFILDIAGPLDLEVILLRVLPPLPPVVVEGAAYVPVEDPVAERIDAQEYLAPVAIELRNKGVRVATEVRSGDPAQEIVAAAGDAGADLIAMSTHGRGGLGRLIFGSVAEAVLRAAKIPVLLMRTTEEEVARRGQREAVR
ncbi:MAG TPA: universal stress protein [Methylomirabilota bacterium]|jgi:nucleotide-binding universal stress UspA family protein|nr:universal stress protein [Methylomirabilota bacterium]